MQIELSREKKWLRMIEVGCVFSSSSLNFHLKKKPPFQQWQSGHSPPKLEERIWKGIPEKLRMMVWPKLLGADRMMRENQVGLILMKFYNYFSTFSFLYHNLRHRRILSYI